MSVEIVDGIRVLKLKDGAAGAKDKADDLRTMVHLWQLLSGGDALRDTVVFERRAL